MSMIYFVCPKCNATEMSIHNLKEKCGFCETDMIETKYETPSPFSREAANKIEQIIFEEYVKDNPLYDPQEEKATQEKIKQNVADFNHMQDMRKSQQQNKPHCPYCNSTDLSKIGTVKRGLSVFAFGLASSKIGKQWHCNKCNSDF